MTEWCLYCIFSSQYRIQLWNPLISKKLHIMFNNGVAPNKANMILSYSLQSKTINFEIENKKKYIYIFSQCRQTIKQRKCNNFSLKCSLVPQQFLFRYFIWRDWVNGKLDSHFTIFFFYLFALCRGRLFF